MVSINCWLISLVLIVSVGEVAFAKLYSPTWESLATRPLPTWFDEAKIGIFIHWGVFSVPSTGTGEWFWNNWENGNKGNISYDFMQKNYKPNFTYAEFAHQFTAEFYDPHKWADIFKASGAKYVVLTSKHHEGYTLWPSKTSWNWNSKDVGANRDLLGDLAAAVRKAGLIFGAYHSLLEWFNPLYLRDKHNNWTTNDFVKFKVRPELEELVNTYKPQLIFSDGDAGAPDTYWSSTDFIAWLYNDSPVKDLIVTNERWGKDLSCKKTAGYMSCHDRFKPKTVQKFKFEMAMTIDKKSWGFRRNAYLHDYLTTHELIATISQTVSCGGNMLINVGPTAYGMITPVYEQRLRELGSWLSINGEAIYATKPWTHQADTVTQHVWYTSKGKEVYAIALQWPQNNELLLGAVDSKNVDSVQLLGVEENLKFKESGTGIIVDFPHLNPDSPVRQAYTLKITMK